MTIRVLASIDAVYAELGHAEIARLTGAKASAVSNWRAEQRFPARTYVALTTELKRRRLRAPESLWGMVKASSA